MSPCVARKIRNGAGLMHTDKLGGMLVSRPTVPTDGLSAKSKVALYVT